MIINGELQTGLGGGVCQVSTTVFNAAYEAGLPITARTNHALYISHYPLGRDATVNYPGHRPEVRQRHGSLAAAAHFVGPYSLTVAPLRHAAARRVESTSAPLAVVAPPPVQKTVDATLEAGRGRRRRLRRAGAGDVRRAQGLLGRRQAALRLDLVLELPRRSRRSMRVGPARSRRSRRRRRRPRRRRRRPRRHRRRRLRRRRRRRLRTSDRLASHVGTRVGRSVAASTVACAVQPSAITTRRRARSRTRSGSARLARRRSGRARRGGRRTSPAAR